MKYLKINTVIFGILMVVVSCRKDDIKTNTPRLTSCYSKYLLFGDGIVSDPNSIVVVTPGDTAPVFRYVYENDHIIRVNGGFVPSPSGSDFSRQVFSPLAYDSVAHSANQVSVFSKFYLEDSIVEKNVNPMVYVLGTDQRLDKVISYNNFNHEIFKEFSFSYSENKIAEVNDSRNYTRREFFFENGNLTRVLHQLIDFQGNVLSEDEILFEDYDNHPNPFRNLYYLDGAFYRAFSKNNYTKYTINHYGFHNDGTYGLLSSRWNSYQISYNSEGYPEFGDYN